LNLVGDFGGGGMLLAFGIACALVERSSSGRGQIIDAAMVDGASSLMTYMYAMQAAGRWTGRGENGLSGAAPHYGVYETSDGKFVSIGASEAKFWARLLTLLGLDAQELPARNDPANWPALKAKLAAVFRTRTRDEWCALLQDEDVCFAPLLTLAEATQHPHLRERGSHVSVAGIVQPAPAPRFSRTAPQVPTPPVEAGSDLAKALENWGFEAGEADALARSGVAR
jgi:alpha-methylacyl-CoA racemase